MSQICAESLQVPIENAALSSPDTDGSPFNLGTTASRVTYTIEQSGASKEAEKQIKQAVSEMLECSAEDIELLPGGRAEQREFRPRCIIF